MTARICVCGSTGSIGTQTLDLCNALGLPVVGLACGKNVALAEEQLRRFRPALVAVSDETAAHELRLRTADLSYELLAGEVAATQLCARVEADIIVNAMGGICGLLPSLAAAKRPLTLATANKESIVVAGDFIRQTAREHGCTVLPIDSEHSAMFQSMQGEANSRRYLRRLLLTASGGPFRNRTTDELWNVTVEEAANHPVWNMGKKVSVDSATLMNKGLELIEAVRLFDVDESDIFVLIHPQSIVHSMAEFCDGSIIGQLGAPDMRTCIKFALTYPARVEGLNQPLSFEDLTLNFRAAQSGQFPLIDLARDAIRRKKAAPCVLNAADEAAVELFLHRKIRFPEIFSVVQDAYSSHCTARADSPEELLALDRELKREILSASR